ncbi:alpha-glucan family phosphorylase [Jatrophihabitans endophyticus]|uniref:alpha-glucan family phosphorylase n=1 Tax=Jatrophihabitans endophyticus TaxID=1206085 RepID=UPI0019E9EBC8|nr:alpha-glucan family phosphorylase [Jatrophihabitans endophyticus]MBE7188059.1 alpha-glucan family phosphorylase [Jatrophihabitans endophyticus]
MKALRRLTVRAAYPPALAQLGELVANLRWSWHADSIDLFESVDPALWQSCEHDPGRMLGEVSADRFAELARDRKFVRRLNDLHDDLAEYLSAPRWYQQQADRNRAEGSHWPERIAYFSPEFGITEVLPQYSGGLGILAGDHLKAASDLGVPIIGVGLLYGAGYFRQSLSRDGWQLEHYPSLDPQGLPISALEDASGAPVKISIALPESRTLRAQVWVAQVGRVPLLLLDSDIEENDADARQVTDRLYGGGAEHRLEQELLLGVGGVRAIRAYCEATGSPEPTVFHTNEGHAGFLGVERIRELVESRGLSFDEALTAVRAGTVFTTHTPVPAGIDRFPRDLVAAHLMGLTGGDGSLAPERILDLGAEDDPGIFNMAHMGLRLGQRANGVSVLHGEVSRGMFAGLWPGFDVADVPITSVTNGVHAPTWMSREIVEVLEKHVGTEVLSVPATGLGADEGGDWSGIDRARDAELWRVRNELRERLVHEIRRRMRASYLQRGMAAAELGWIDDAFAPAVLTIGFARRVPSYKRLTLMLRDPDRLKALLLDPQRPVQIVIAGKSHPADDGGKQLIAQMVRFADDPEVRHRITFLPDYDIGMARYLYWGVDVWLNNPLRPLEACGTSGMKAALNGALNLSILDGWWDEWFDGDNGWAIPSADGLVDPDRRDDLEADALYELIRSNVATRFYDRTASGVPTRWVQMVRHTLRTLGPKVLASRMVAEYVRRLYVPAGASSEAMAADDFAAARDLAAWSAQVVAAWPQVSVLHVDSQLSGAGDAQVGESLTLRAEVALGGLSDEQVSVEAVYGRVDAEDRLVDVESSALRLVESIDGTSRYEGEIALERTGAFGYSVRVLPRDDRLASPAELGVVAIA